MPRRRGWIAALMVFDATVTAISRVQGIDGQEDRLREILTDLVVLRSTRPVASSTRSSAASPPAPSS